MSAVQAFLIADQKVGLEKDLEPWLLPNDAYPELDDCYMWRGRIKKKQGYRLLGRLNRVIGQTNGSGAFTFTFPNIPMVPGATSIVIGAEFFQDKGDAGPSTTLLTNGPGSGTLNRTTGVLTITGAPISTNVLYFSGLPVMGLPSLEPPSTTTEGLVSLMAFDTVYSYIFDGSSSAFIDASFYKGNITTPLNWTGTDYNFFWTTNYAGALWATNFVPGYRTSPNTNAGSGDGIRWYDQVIGTGWINFLPQITGTPTYLNGCLIILPYKGRLITFNTWEGTTSPGSAKNFPQRARWSAIGTPYYVGGAAIPTSYLGGSNANAWRSDIVGQGGFVDAPTSENIVSAQFIKDTLVVFFERSTWQLQYTGNILLPFIWVKINTELGALSTFSEVPFDKVVLGVGDVGIHACDSVNVNRIDQKIPDDVFSIQNENQGRERVYGIRDYFTQLVYWTVPYVGDEFDEQGDQPTPSSTLTYPNKILVYNYIDQSFSYFNDSFTCFGYYQIETGGITWSTATMTWESANFPWVGGFSQPFFPYVVAGNQQGFVEILTPDLVINDVSLLISNITYGVDGLVTITSENHNIDNIQFINIVTASGTTGFTGLIWEVVQIVDNNNFVINTADAAIPPSGTFTGSGTFAVVSNINILTKRFNPFIGEAAQVRLSYIDFYFQTTQNGQLQVNLFIDEDSTIPINATDNVVATFPESTYTFDDDVNPFVNNKIWKRVYFQDISQLFQIQLMMNNTQMQNIDVVSSPIVLHAMILYFAKGGRLINV